MALKKKRESKTKADGLCEDDPTERKAALVQVKAKAAKVKAAKAKAAKVKAAKVKAAKAKAAKVKAAKAKAAKAKAARAKAKAKVAKSKAVRVKAAIAKAAKAVSAPKKRAASFADKSDVTDDLGKQSKIPVRDVGFSAEAVDSQTDPFEAAKQKVKGSVPAIVDAMVELAKQGSCSHAKTLLELTGAKHMLKGTRKRKAAASRGRSWYWKDWTKRSLQLSRKP